MPTISSSASNTSNKSVVLKAYSNANVRLCAKLIHLSLYIFPGIFFSLKKFSIISIVESNFSVKIEIAKYIK